MRKLICFFFLLLVPSSVTAQKKIAPKIDTIIKEVPVYSKMQADSLQQVYFEILKSTNEQLNNYWTPVNWFLGALGVLVAVGAIAAGYLIFVQSKDFKEQRDKIFTDFEESKNVVINGASILLKAKESEFDKLKSDVEALLPLLEKQSNTKVKEAVSNILSKNYEVDTTVLENVSKYLANIYLTIVMKCSKCNKTEEYKIPNTYPRSVLLVCKSCGELAVHHPVSS